MGERTLAKYLLSERDEDLRHLLDGLQVLGGGQRGQAQAGGVLQARGVRAQPRGQLRHQRQRARGLRLQRLRRRTHCTSTADSGLDEIG